MPQTARTAALALEKSEPSSTWRIPEAEDEQSNSARSTAQLLSTPPTEKARQEEKKKKERKSKVVIDDEYWDGFSSSASCSRSEAAFGSKQSKGFGAAVSKSLISRYLANEVEQEVIVGFAGTEYIDDDFDATDPLAVAIEHFKRVREDELKNYRQTKDKVPFLIDDEDVSIVANEYKQSRAVRQWRYFDSVFGFAVAANAFLEAMATEDLIDGSSSLFYIASSCFCVSFIVEFAIRWHFTRGGFREMMDNTWNVFDLFVITISAIDLWILEILFPTVGGGGAFVIIRVIRMVRFIRLLRLLRTLKALWFLVQSYLRAMPILIWSCLCILILSYTFGLLCLELIGFYDHLKNDSEVQRYWGNLRKCMISILQISTFDHAASLMRTVVEGRHAQPQFVFLFLPIITIIGLGLFNLIVGALLVCCFELGQADTVIEKCTVKLLRHKALDDIENFMNDVCHSQIGATPDEAVLTSNLVLCWIEHNAKVEDGRTLQQLFADADVTTEDVVSIFREVASIQGQHALVRVHDFIQGCLFIQSDIHDLQLSQYIAAQYSMYTRLSLLNEFLDAACHVLHQAQRQVLPALLEFGPHRSTYKFRQFQNDEDSDSSDSEHGDKNVEKSSLKDDWMAENRFELHKFGKFRPQGHMMEAELAEMGRQRKLQLEEHVWLKFDSVFLVLVAINAIMLGVDATRQNDHERNFTSDNFKHEDFLLALIEMTFVVMFTIEIMLRCAMFFQLRECESYHTFLFVMPTVIFDGNMSLIGRIIRRAPDLLMTDMYVCFDLVLVFLGVLDNFVLRWFMREAKYFSILRIFRTLRMLRIARTFYLLHDIQAIFGTVLNAMPTVLWNLIMLGGILYISAVFVVTIVAPCIHGDDQLKKKWEDFVLCFYSLWTLATRTNWETSARQVSSNVGAWSYLVFSAIVLFCGLGVMNVSVGAVVQQSFRFSVLNAELERRIAGKRLKKLGLECTKKLFNSLQAKVDRVNAREKSKKRFAALSYFNAWKQLCDEEKAKEQSKFSKVVAMPPDSPTGIAVPAAQTSEQTAVQATPMEVDSGKKHKWPMLNGKKTQNKKTKEEQHTLPEQPSASVVGKPEFGRVKSSTSLSEEEVKEDILNGWAVSVTVRPNVDPTTVHAAELMELLEDEEFLNGLSRESLRPDQIIMLYQRLDVLKVGAIDIDYFIEGLQRFMFSIDGLDISCTKSLARCLFSEATQMAREAEIMNQLFLDICCMIRGITAVGSDKTLTGSEMEIDLDDELGDIVQLARAQVATDENKRITRKVNAVTQHIETMTQILERHGDTKVRVSMELLEYSDDISVTSVDSGKD